MDLKDLINKYTGYFIVNYDDFEVIYTEGYENTNGLWCYRISDLDKKKEEDKPQAVQEEQVIEETSQENEGNTESEEEKTE